MKSRRKPAHVAVFLLPECLPDLLPSPHHRAMTSVALFPDLLGIEARHQLPDIVQAMHGPSP
jgi:hypothetical protein